MDNNWRGGKEGQIQGGSERGGQTTRAVITNVFHNDRQMGKIQLADVIKMPVKLCKVSRQQNEI